MPRITLQTLEETSKAYNFKVRKHAYAYNTEDFYLFFGITKKQWAKFKQTKKLKVSQAAALKLKHASLLNNPHHKALFKVLEARSKEAS